MQVKTNILIVDDIKENHLVMESVLASDDVNIVKAMSGEEALTLCSTHSFAVILLDVQMPGMDGFETADILRSIEKTRNIPIIFVTAISKEKKAIYRGYELGAVDYLFKPIEPIVLKSKVRFFIEYYRQRLLIEKQAEELSDKVRELTSIVEEKERLENLSIIDPLTSVYNRRGLSKYLSMHLKNCSRYQLPISVIVVDLDNFKQYNDNYGHVNGDIVLKEVSSLMKLSMHRPEDFIGRLGGEEFIAVLPNTDIDGAEFVASRIIKQLTLAKIEHAYNEVNDIITVSMGITTVIPDKTTTQEELIDTADMAMYKAKDSGKNCYYSKEVR